MVFEWVNNIILIKKVLCFTENYLLLTCSSLLPSIVEDTVGATSNGESQV